MDFSIYPKLYGFMDDGAIEAAGIAALQRQEYLRLQGEGVLIGLVDTGIEYQNPVFLDDAGRCRVVSIWDQTLDGEAPVGFDFGREFRREEIQEALREGYTLATYDGLGSPEGDEAERGLYERSCGHGTFLAGVAAGKDFGEEFCGAVPRAEIVMVKVRDAGRTLRELYCVDAGLPAVSEEDVIDGVRYLLEQAELLRKPMVILLGLGTNLGDHSGNSAFGDYLSEISSRNGLVIVVPAGNEAVSAHHFFGDVVAGSEYTDVEINVSEGVTGFVAELWGRVPRGYEVSLITPTGEMSARVSAELNSSGDMSFRLVDTVASVSYLTFTKSGLTQLIFIRLRNPASGTWKVRVYKNSEYADGFHIWLPISGFLTGEVAFTRPDPSVTVTEPGNVGNVVTIAAYRYQDGVRYALSGRGPARGGGLKPDITAPGVDITGPAVYQGRFPVPARTEVSYTRRSGTSVAAALMSGACAQLLEWGCVKGNLPIINTSIAAGLLYTGAAGIRNVDLPNNEWGYGTLNVYRSILEA